MFLHTTGEAHLSSMSGSRSGWSSDHDRDITQQDYNIQNDWMTNFHTPPPDPTQMTQYDEQEQRYMLPPRHRQAPIRGYSPSPFQAGPPPRRTGRTRPHRED